MKAESTWISKFEKLKKSQEKQKHYLDDPIRIYACHGNDPNPASSPPTILLCAVCFANDTPQPREKEENNAQFWLNLARWIFDDVKLHAK